MTESELAALEALANAATPGPWHESPCSNGGALLKRGTDVGPERHGQSSVQIVPASDAAYIAAMHPGTVLGLIAEVRRLRGIAESCDAWKWECEQCNAENRGLRGALNRALSTSREGAELQRLRALVESAFAEGQAATDGRYEYGWDDSASRKALDPR